MNIDNFGICFYIIPFFGHLANEEKNSCHYWWCELFCTNAANDNPIIGAYNCNKHGLNIVEGHKNKNWCFQCNESTSAFYVPYLD